LWIKLRRDVSPAVQTLGLAPIGHEFAPELKGAFLTVGGLERQQVCPIRGFDPGAFNRPAQVAQVPLLKAQLFAFILSGFTLSPFRCPLTPTHGSDTMRTGRPVAVDMPQSVTCSSPRRSSDRAILTVSQSGAMVCLPGCAWQNASIWRCR
jgi:hypothetical protein